MAIQNPQPTKTTYIIEAEHYNSKQGRLVKSRIEVNASTSIRDALIQIGKLTDSVSGEAKIIFIHSLINY